MPRNIYEPTTRRSAISAREFIDRSVRPRHEEFHRGQGLPARLLARGRQAGPPRPPHPGGVRRRRRARTTASPRRWPRSWPRSTSRASCFGIHADVCPPYLVDLGTEEQKQRWLPGIATGDLSARIGMTEPSGGSDLAALKTTAVRDGDDWVLNGSKTFITNGYRPTSSSSPPAPTRPRARGHHPVRGRDRHGGVQPRPQARQGRAGRVRHRRAVLRGRPGARREPHRRRGHGLHRDDGAPPAGAGRRRRRQHRARQRDPRRDHRVREAAQGLRPVDRVFQHNKFLLAELVRRRSRSPRPTSTTASSPTPRASCSASTRPRPSGGARRCRTRSSTPCVQLHGGYGYMNEYRVARAWRDARVTKIWAGSNEIMKELIGRDLGL